MSKTLKIVIAALCLAATATAAWAAINCPIDNMSAYSTGVTQVDTATGKLLYQHKCPNGHVFWTLSM